MSGRQRIQQFFVGMMIAGVLGCGSAQPMYLTSQGQVDKHYIKSATRISYPDTCVESSQEVLGAMQPYTVANADQPLEFREISLEEAVCIAMQNSRVIRNLNGVNFSSGGIQGVPQGLLSAPSSVATVYDVAITESDPRYGVQAALSAFDAQLSSSIGWSQEDRGTPYGGAATNSDQGTFQTSIQKTNATGGTTYITNGNAYLDGSSSASYPGGSYWTSYIQAGISQPLLQGRGVQFNRIAGPGAIAGFYNGVSIARINTDITLTDFEISSRNLVYDVERAYWNLYYAYHRLESVKAGYLSAATTWNNVYEKAIAGTRGGDAQSEAEARSQYFLFRARTEQAQSDLFNAEATFRWILGLSPADGRFFRPSTEPTVAPLKLEWNDVLIEALARSPELRKQKWSVKSRELELLASKNYLLPQLNLNASYRFNGTGKDWIDSESSHSSAYGSLTGDDYADWSTSLSFQTTIGKRKEHAAVRNAQLQLTKAQTILQQQELELVHQLNNSLREIDKYYRLCQTGLQQRISDEKQVQASNAAYEAGTSTLDRVLEAQRKLAESETEFYNNVVQYNLAIAELHRRKGSLLEYNNVYLSEGPWPTKAYVDAREEARKRDAGLYLNYGYTRPQVFSRGTYQQFMGTVNQPAQEGMFQEFEQQPMEQPQYAPPGEVETLDEEYGDVSTTQYNPVQPTLTRTNSQPNNRQVASTRQVKQVGYNNQPQRTTQGQAVFVEQTGKNALSF